jgi:hypothetical protein
VTRREMSEKEKTDLTSRPEGKERPVRATGSTSAQSADDAERSLARGAAIGIPLGTVALSIGVCVASSLGPALLVFAAGALLGTITLMWASLRTLGGDAPLPTGLAIAALVSRDDRAVAERKRTVLLALKDLEHERDIGKIDEADYQIVAGRYRTEAKTILREIDDDAAPNRSRAEQIARSHLKKRGLLATDDDREHDDVANRVSIEPAPPTTKSAPPPPMTKELRPECSACKTSNEPDASFCKKCGASLTKTSDDASEKQEKEEAPVDESKNDDDAGTTEKQA